MSTTRQPGPLLDDAASITPIVAPAYQALVPPLHADELALLEESLQREGCREPLVVWKQNGILLDGHNRFAICTRLGIPFAIKAMSFDDRDDAMLWVLENQLGRRNVADIDRIALAARREPLIKARAAANRGTRTDLLPKSAGSLVPTTTRDAAAAIAGVGQDKYVKGKKVLDSGAPELVQAVREGDASIHAAAEVAELPVEKQVEVVAAGTIKETADELRSNRRAKNTGNNEWGTPREYVHAVRQVLGEIDLDPATHAGAQARIQAKQFYTVEHDGLTKPWSGTVFLNPPYSARLIRKFIEKLVSEYVAGNVSAAVLLTNNETDAKWFQSAAEHASYICFPKQRIRFLRPDGQRSRSGALQGQTVFFFGNDGSKFVETFREFGVVVCALGPALEV